MVMERMERAGEDERTGGLYEYMRREDLLDDIRIE